MMASRINKAVQDPRAAFRYVRGLVDPRSESDVKLAHDAGDYWSASRDIPVVKDMSHWRGEGRWDADTWTAIGERHVALFESLPPSSLDQPITRVLEWGPGGGSNVLAFSHRFPIETFYGVDISAPNLEECARQCASYGFSGFRPIEIDPEVPEAVGHRVDVPLDLFLSTAVYQHFPGKEYGRRVTCVASDLLRPGGLALIQTRYPEGSRRFRAKHRDYKSHAITFTAYGVAEFWALLIDAGLVPMAVHLWPETNYAFYIAMK